MARNAQTRNYSITNSLQRRYVGLVDSSRIDSLDRYDYRIVDRLEIKLNIKTNLIKNVSSALRLGQSRYLVMKHNMFLLVCCDTNLEVSQNDHAYARLQSQRQIHYYAVERRNPFYSLSLIACE